MTKQELIELAEKMQEDTNEHRTWYVLEEVVKYLQNN